MSERPQGRRRKPTSYKGQRKPGANPVQSESKSQNSKSAPNALRLNKYISNSGYCSRREADEIIKSGIVSVNGKVITELGVKVQAGDDIRINNARIKNENKVYILMNKPKDFVTTTKDPHAKRTVMDIIGRNVKERIYPVGRLDAKTTGVLLLTNDGDLTTKLTHPKHKQKKIYQVTTNKNVSSKDMERLTEGIKLDDGFICADSISYADPVDKTIIGIEIHSGRNRIVRRMFEHLGYKVVKLDRVVFAGLTKHKLRRGQWRFLTDKEISFLKMIK